MDKNKTQKVSIRRKCFVDGDSSVSFIALISDLCLDYTLSTLVCSTVGVDIALAVMSDLPSNWARLPSNRHILDF